jgi:hypothetical protein
MAERGSEVAKKTKGRDLRPGVDEGRPRGDVRRRRHSKIQLHTHVVGAVTDRQQPARRRRHGVEVRPPGRGWRSASSTAPATATSPPRRAASFDVGINAACECQPMSLMALLTGVDANAIPDYVREVAGEKAKPNLLKLMQQRRHQSVLQRPDAAPPAQRGSSR